MDRMQPARTLAQAAMPMAQRPAPPTQAGSTLDRKAWAAALDFEAQFLKTMLEQSFAGITGEGPMGAEGPGADAWRSLLLEQQAKSMAGRDIGIAQQVYRDMTRTQNRP